MGNPIVTQSDAVFHAVADATRRAILDRLREGELAVNEIAGWFEVTRPAISKHLRVLLDARLVTEERAGRHRMYRLNPQPLQRMDRWLNSYRASWATNLQNLKSHIETKARKPQ